MLFSHGSAPKLHLYFLQRFALPLVNSLAQRIRKKSLTTAVFTAEHHSGVTVAPFAAFCVIGKVQADQLNCSLPRKEKHKRPSSAPPPPFLNRPLQVLLERFRFCTPPTPATEPALQRARTRASTVCPSNHSGRRHKTTLTSGRRGRG